MPRPPPAFTPQAFQFGVGLRLAPCSPHWSAPSAKPSDIGVHIERGAVDRWKPPQEFMPYRIGTNSEHNEPYGPGEDGNSGEDVFPLRRHVLRLFLPCIHS